MDKQKRKKHRQKVKINRRQIKKKKDYRKGDKRTQIKVYKNTKIKKEKAFRKDRGRFLKKKVTNK